MTYAVFSGSQLRGVFKWHAHAVDYAAWASNQPSRPKGKSSDCRIVDLDDLTITESDFHAARMLAYEVESVAKHRYSKETRNG